MSPQLLAEWNGEVWDSKKRGYIGYHDTGWGVYGDVTLEGCRAGTLHHRWKLDEIWVRFRRLLSLSLSLSLCDFKNVIYILP